MAYRLLADVTVAAHLAFLLYVTFGGFLAWRWPRTLALHVVAVVWGFATVLAGFDCPLTDLENWARRRAGIEGLPPSGFIDHYLTGVIYPDSAVGLVRAAVAVTIVVSWFGWWLRRRRVSRVASRLTRQ
ncbi:membrane protein [Rhodococcus ruber Chol-4]|uniref:Membrane protein n=2 Tax=Rhodococcus TaxID=1827 RepID=A0A0M9WMD7_RHORH|nr:MULTISPECIES: DUF2784 domain-containing protein [Rhodococcus]MDO2379155.1 DUF2784 domain-containing protein [Rhodococcus ruber]ATQ27845.1 DUF2784 domain-containing protein [Rhodococcus ruber]AUM15182.1 DUF2784 domain-containing protein [Rhodococcus ruber]KOS54381.1 membrane protein [Rhodococcus rhodochrous KG-21]KXF86686.1 membrane protein [Rhodococcus ruber Chol-4]